MKLVLRDDNFLAIAQALYDNPQCTTDEEFYDDLARMKYLKKLFTRFEETGELKERLILNHIVVLNNVFGPEHLPRLLFLKMHKQFPYVKPFLEYLAIMPPYIENVRVESRVPAESIVSDVCIVEALRNI
jgi:hypothetical protein